MKKAKKIDKIEKPKIDVVICTPGHSVMAQYLTSLLETMAELTNRKITWALSIQYASMVTDAREMTANNGKENDLANSLPFRGEFDYKKMFWIDSDIAWTPDDFMKLYESDKDIISGAYLLGNGDVTAYKKELGEGYKYEEVKEMTEPVQIEGAGFGFICVKQGVFETLSRPWFGSIEVTKTMPDGTVYTFPVVGEDLSWCYKVRRKGFDIWFDPSVRVTHHKTVQLTWEGMKPL